MFQGIMLCSFLFVKESHKHSREVKCHEYFVPCFVEVSGSLLLLKYMKVVRVNFSCTKNSKPFC